MRSHTTIRALAAAVLATGALTIAACGEDAADAGSGAQPVAADDAALKFAECMRENGVDMPDPSSSGGRQVFRVGPGEETTPEEFEQAQEACEKYREDIETPQLSEEQQQEFREAALEHARCMREHGIENFPDPTFGEGGGAQIRIGPDSGIDPEDPDFQDAQEACESKRPEGPGTTAVGEAP